MESTSVSASRYRTDFEELALLGRGGFGFVTKCRSRLSTDCIYAVKCIQLGEQCDSLEFMLREASNLARLHHKNVVRYFTAWLEKDSVQDSLTQSHDEQPQADARIPPAHLVGQLDRGSSIEDGSSSTSKTLRHSSSAGWLANSPGDVEVRGTTALRIDSFWQRHAGQPPPAGPNATRGSSTESEAVGFAGSSEEGDIFALSGRKDTDYASSSESACVSFQVSQTRPQKVASPRLRVLPATGDSSLGPASPVGPQSVSIPEIAAARRTADSRTGPQLHRWNSTGRGDATTQRSSIDPVYEGNKLYIVMEYVEGCTLRNLILDRLCDDPNLAWDLVRQILEGLSYMHKNNLLHRDVKPENIFIRTTASASSPVAEYQVKIGDLGLSRSLDSSTSMRVESGTRSTGGNFLHSMSTNVGTHFYIAPEVEAGARYDQAADMYALGVVLFEMFHPPFETTMERYKELTSLQQTHEVSGVGDVTVARLISELLQADPEKRPSASAMLEHCVSRIVNNDLLPIINNVLSRPYSYEMLKVLATIFGRKEAPCTPAILVEPPEANRVRQHFHRVMRSFNAIYYEPPVLIPHNENSLGWFDRSLKYIDISGSPLQPPSCFAAVLRSTLPAVQNATVVRRYTLARAQGANGGITICHSQRMHAAFDVIANIDKLGYGRHQKGGTADEDYSLVRECLLEMEPVHVVLQTLQAFPNLNEDVQVIGFYGTLLPLIIHFLVDITYESALTVIQALEEDVREAALVLKEVQAAEFERQWSFGDLEERVRELERIMQFEGTAGELRKFTLSLVGSLLPSAQLDSGVGEIAHILEKLAYWDGSSRLFGEAKSRGALQIRFRAYLPHAADLLQSRTGFGFAVLGPNLVNANGGPIAPSVMKSLTSSKLVPLAFGGSLAMGSLISNYVELDLECLIESVSGCSQAGRHGARRVRNRGRHHNSMCGAAELTAPAVASGSQLGVAPASAPSLAGSFTASGGPTSAGAQLGGLAAAAQQQGYSVEGAFSSAFTNGLGAGCLPLATPLDAKLWLEAVCGVPPEADWRRCVAATSYTAASLGAEASERSRPGAVVVVLSEMSLVEDAYWLKSRLSDCRIACEVSAVFESELSKAKKSSRVAALADVCWWLVYTTYRGKSAAREKGFRLCPLKLQQTSGDKKELVDACDKWFESRQSLLHTIVQVYVDFSTAAASPQSLWAVEPD